MHPINRTHRNHSHRLWSQPLTEVRVIAALALIAVTMGTAKEGPGAGEQVAPFDWPKVTQQTRPWAYWWWMGSAVDETNLTRELRRYSAAGLGGVHIIPIYGAKGYEERFIPYLSPKWMEMMHYTVREANKLGMGVDMTMGTGWCFGGPEVTDAEANASVVAKAFEVEAGARLEEKFDAKSLQALMGFSSDGKSVDLLSKVDASGALDWTAEGGRWRVYAISQKPSGQKVKRAAPGGQGWMLNLFYAEGMVSYLRSFDAVFAQAPSYTSPNPRAMYHDSYEYKSDWAPDLFASFEQRRKYRLQGELPALFNTLLTTSNAQEVAPGRDQVARVKSDYRETVSDIMADTTLPLWVEWSHKHGFVVRNEAHGSPGNWLDLYGVADIPETEMFHTDRNKLVSKFASSAAHVTGKPLASSETCTWIKEHFTETLGDVKGLFDDMFLSGINHMFYHGTCYSPDEAGWPGWVFYASLEMNPRNSIWHDVPAVNAYAARCQSVLQSGEPENDVLVYWPIYDLWHNPNGLVEPMTVHSRDWFEGQAIGRTAKRLWDRGYAFDYISDRQLSGVKADGAKIRVPGHAYRAVVVPRTRLMPVETLRHLVRLAEGGGTVIFEGPLPEDVPGWGELGKRREEFKGLIGKVGTLAGASTQSSVRVAAPADGRTPVRRVLVGDLEAELLAAGVPREEMFDRPGLMSIRRSFQGGRYYFIANQSEKAAVDDWVPLAFPARSAVILEPWTGQTGLASLRKATNGSAQVYLQLGPGQSVILRCLEAKKVSGEQWAYWDNKGQTVALPGPWQVKFLQGGPELPGTYETSNPGSWAEQADTNAQRFAGTAVYTTVFDAPDRATTHWRLSLGKVGQSARVRLNGSDCGTVILPPFEVVVGPLKSKKNVLEVEVTNVSANRVRDLDRRGVKWRNFYDINFVNLNYRPFDASGWPLTDSGLMGPVTVRPLKRL